VVLQELMSGGHSSLRISPPRTKIDKGDRGNMLSMNIKSYAYIEAQRALIRLQVQASSMTQIVVRLLNPVITVNGSDTIQYLARVILALDCKQDGVVLGIEQHVPVGIKPVGLSKFMIKFKCKISNIYLLFR
jgi:hypothetical protein